MSVTPRARPVVGHTWQERGRIVANTSGFVTVKKELCYAWARLLGGVS